MMKADRNAARGQYCTLRVAGHKKCSGTNSTVLAHAPCRDKGTGYKSPDWWAAFACFKCHQLIDRKAKLEEWNHMREEWEQRHLTQPEIDAAWLRGIYETIAIRRAEGEDDLPF